MGWTAEWESWMAGHMGPRVNPDDKHHDATLIAGAIYHGLRDGIAAAGKAIADAIREQWRR